MSARYFLPEVLETNNQLTVTESPTDSAFVADGQKFVILDGLIDTDNYTTAERTFDLSGGGFNDTIVHLRYNLNGNPVNGFTPSGLDNFYVVDSADTSYNPLSAIGAAIADNGGALTDETTEANEGTADDMTLLPAVPVAEDAYYFGAGSAFSKLTLNISTAMNTAGGSITLIWEYYNGSTWSAIPIGTLVDGTGGLENSGTNDVTFPRPNDWAKTTIGVSGEVEAYYIRIRVSAITPTLTTIPIGQQAWTGTAETHFESISDDLFIARIVVNGSNQVTSISSIVNPSKLIVQKGLFEDSLTRNILTDNDITNNTQTINQGESGAGITAGTAGWIIDRGSLTNFEMRYVESSGMFEAGLTGSLRPIPRFVDATPANGRVMFTDQTIGDEVGVDVLYWDKANNRLGIGVSSPLDSLDVLGEVRVTIGFHSGTDTGHLAINSDSSNNRIAPGYANRFIGLAAGGFKLQTAATNSGGSLITWIESIQANATGDLGFGVAPAASNKLTVEGNLRLNATTPIITVANTGGTQGLVVNILVATGGTNPLFTIKDDALSKDVLIIRQDSVWLIDSPRVRITENDGVPNAALEIGSVTGVAVLRLDSQNGDFVGTDHVEISQLGTGELVIATLTNGGDIIIAPKYTDPTSTGNVGIGNSDMTTEQKLHVEGNIILKVGTPAYIMKDTSAANQVWNMYQSAQTFHIGEDTTPNNSAISIAFGGRKRGPGYGYIASGCG